MRHDLSRPQQVVQASHACIIAGQNMDADCYPYLVVIGVRNEAKLRSIMEKVRETCNVYPFYEPDMNNELTAFATQPVAEDLKPNFQKYQLLQ